MTEALASGLSTPTRSISNVHIRAKDQNYSSMNILTGGGGFENLNDLKTLHEIEVSTGSYFNHSSKRSAVAAKNRQAALNTVGAMGDHTKATRMRPLTS